LKVDFEQRRGAQEVLAIDPSEYPLGLKLVTQKQGNEMRWEIKGTESH